MNHVSDLQWDRLLAGELSAGAAAAVREHARGCTECAARLHALTAERDAFGRRPVGFALARPARGVRWWGVRLAPVLAAAALLIAVRARVDRPGERRKGGGPTLLLAAGRPGALVQLASGDAIHPGEYLQAGYTAARDGFGAVVSRDGGGAVTVYVPANGDAMVALPAGVERSFPQSTILDDVLGGERIAIVWCEAPRELAPVIIALRADLPIAPLEGCATRELVLDKQGAVR